jgi:hypothetical protein
MYNVTHCAGYWLVWDSFRDIEGAVGFSKYGRLDRNSGRMARVEEMINEPFAQGENARQACALDVRGRISQNVVTSRELDSIQFVARPSVCHA